MNNSLRIFVCTLLAVMSLVSCESSDPTVNSVASFSDDINGQTMLYLSTGSDSTQLENAWFCSYIETQNQQYIDRKQMHFWDTGEALIDGSSGSWSLDGANLTIEYAGHTEQYDNLVFLKRLTNGDMLKASSDNGVSIACDWSGPPRAFGAQNDGSNIPNIEEITGSAIDEILSNGRSDISHDAYWLCQLDPPIGGSFELFLFDDGKMISTIDGRWSRESADSIELDLNGTTELWSKIEIRSDDNNVPYSFFSAETDFGPVSCQWSGKPRASAWVSDK